MAGKPKRPVVLDPQCLWSWAGGRQVHPFRFPEKGIEIDTTSRTAWQTAMAILRHVRDMEKGVTCDDEKEDDGWAVVSRDSTAPEEQDAEVERSWVDVKTAIAKNPKPR